LSVKVRIPDTPGKITNATTSPFDLNDFVHEGFHEVVELVTRHCWSWKRLMTTQKSLTSNSSKLTTKGVNLRQQLFQKSFTVLYHKKFFLTAKKNCTAFWYCTYVGKYFHRLAKTYGIAEFPTLTFFRDGQIQIFEGKSSKDCMRNM
jgi:hypothetical protein